MSRAVLMTQLSRSLSQDAQMGMLMRAAVERGLDTVAIARCDPAAAVATVKAGTADVVLAVKPDPAGLLDESGVPVTYLRPPAPRKLDERPLNRWVIAGVSGRLLLGALERTGGDTTLIARVFNVPLRAVVDFDVERRRRTAVAA